ncbi:stage III sporulation protein AG [Gorillibacterium massiliense]|uniref:stage III sporulation protein AG n=1 Tax=Gorillibacterium massiliense TaxID=1280390 RepID=UPI0004AF011F|nr:stage III sporulation protein AG [Gorillibacterium massiliense]
MGYWSKKLEQWLGGGASGAKRARTFRWLLIIGLIGAALMLITQFTVKEVDPIGTGRASPSPEVQADAQPVLGGSGHERASFADYEHAYESQLKELLQKIVGVGDVDVMVTIESTEETVVEKSFKTTSQSTQEKDQAGATRQITDVTNSGEVVLYSVSNAQSPIVVKYIKPRIRGVVIVARGSENPTVKHLLVEAVQRGLDVSPNRIAVIPRKQ